MVRVNHRPFSSHVNVWTRTFTFAAREKKQRPCSCSVFGRSGFVISAFSWFNKVNNSESADHRPSAELSAAKARGENRFHRIRELLLFSLTKKPTWPVSFRVDRLRAFMVGRCQPVQQYDVRQKIFATLSYFWCNVLRKSTLQYSVKPTCRCLENEVSMAAGHNIHRNKTSSKSVCFARTVDCITIVINRRSTNVFVRAAVIYDYNLNR